MKKKNYTKWMIAIVATSIIIWSFASKRSDNLSIDDVSTSESIGAEEVQQEESLGEILNQEFDIKTTLAFQNLQEIHSDFRKNFKYHFQTVGLAEYPDSSYVFVVSEPSPQVSENDIKTVFSKLNCDFQIRQHKIGYDGFARDMLIVVGKVTKENITHLKSNLHSRLYFTSYKSERSTIELPVKENRQYFSKSNLNYEISLAELNKWFFEENELFVDANDNTFSTKEILSNNKSGVFFSKDAGFVAWVIDKQEDLNRQKQNIRQFTLDADLILGAFSNRNKLVIIGRERVSSLSELPPLNVETILLLASVKDSELSQSLDMNDLLAGKMNNDYDWCPTYLSKELENTEFGHLLTITDILLKDWSEHGILKYEEYNYPKPKSYPFDKPLFKKLGIQSLVYNWNTENAIISVEMPNFNIYSLTRTGALPVSYFDNSRNDEIPVGGDYEQQAYKYFANTHNTDLARVVQYQTLYALFKNNDITYNGYFLNNNPPLNKPYLLKDKVQVLLTNIKKLSNTEKNTIAQNIAEDLYKRYQKGEVEKLIATDENTMQKEISNNQKFVQKEIRRLESEANLEIEKLKREFYESAEVEIKKATREIEQYIANEVKKSGRSESDSEVIQFKKGVWADHNKSIADYKRQNEIDLNKQIAEYRQQVNKQIAEYKSEQYINLKNYEEDTKRKIANTSQEVIAENKKTILSDLNKAQALLKDLGDNSFSNLCCYLSYPRGDKYAEESIVETGQEIAKHLEGVVGINKGYYQHFGVDMSEIMTFYSNLLNDNSSLWQKTPSLVLTYHKPNIVGGHNLSSVIRLVSSLSAVSSINTISKNINRNLNISTATPRNRSEVISIAHRVQRGL